MCRLSAARAALVAAAAWALVTPAVGQCLRVGASLPVIGRPVALTVRPADGQGLPDGQAVHFRVVPEDGEGAEAWSADSEVANGTATIRWAATEPGAYRVEAEVAGRALPPVAVFAVTRPLHFSYWSCPVTQRYATAVMENGETAADADRWLDRGILPLQWKPGAIEGYETPEQWAADYIDLRPGRAGITVDEFWGAGAPPHRDEPACLGLLMARAQAPGIFQAPYCLTVEREIVRQAFAQADLCQVELYRRDFRGYADLERALTRFVEAGLGDHTIPILAAGPGNTLWITTEAEMRRQVQAVRWALPDTPGVGFFPDFYPGLAEAADRAIADFFLGPVIWLRDGLLRNIGEMPARDVRLRLPDGSEQALGLLPPGARRAVPARTEVLPGGGYTTIAPQPQPATEPTAEEAAALAGIVGTSAGRPALDLAELSLERAESPDPDVNGQVRGGTLALPTPIDGGPVSLCFDLTVDRCHFYGTVGVWLAGAGTSRLGISLAHNDHDGDIPAASPRPEFVAWSEGKVPVSETCPLGLTVGTPYRFLLTFDGVSRLRVAIWEIGGAGTRLLWASEVPFAGPLAIDRLRLEVRPYEGSAVEVTPEGALLRGVSGGEKPSPYVLEAHVSGLRAG